MKSYVKIRTSGHKTDQQSGFDPTFISKLIWDFAKGRTLKNITSATYFLLYNIRMQSSRRNWFLDKKPASLTVSETIRLDVTFQGSCCVRKPEQT